MWKIAILVAVLAAAPAPAYARGLAPKPPAPGPFAPPTGTLVVCNASGARPVTGSFTYTLAAQASAGGTQTFNLAVGACSAQIFYPQGAPVTVTENVPAGYSVTSIAIGGGGSTISSNTPAAGAAIVTIGSGQSLLTFTTSGPVTTAAPRDCKVPNVIGLGLTAAKAALVKASCTRGLLHRAYSRTFRAGHVISESPRRGTVLAHGAPVDLVVSR
ncbi:MAG: PASTA domain-containing protein, partial [Gaiellaceae bacterium]